MVKGKLAIISAIKKNEAIEKFKLEYPNKRIVDIYSCGKVSTGQLCDWYVTYKNIIGE